MITILPSDTFGIKGVHTFTFRNKETGRVIYSFTKKNLIVTLCKNMVAQRLGGAGNNCNITYGAVGTNATAPAVGDTILGTELARALVSSASYSGNVVTILTFFDSSEANGALKEFGLFGEAATGAADSGTLINHLAIDFTKTSLMTLTVESVITVG